MNDTAAISIYRYIVANVREKCDIGPDHNLQLGTKHFAPGARVYVAHLYPGKDRIWVNGRHRGGNQFINHWMPIKHRCNFRLVEEHSPSLNKYLRGRGLVEALEQEGSSLKATIDWLNQFSMREEVQNTANRHTATAYLKDMEASTQPPVPMTTFSQAILAQE